jgi:hypothetical protein
MEDLEPRGVRDHRLQVRRVIGAARRKAHQMLVAPAVADLHDAQPVARGDKTHRLCIDGDRTLRQHARRQVFFMEIDCHRLPLSPRAPRHNGAMRAASLFQTGVQHDRAAAPSVPRIFERAMNDLTQTPEMLIGAMAARAREASALLAQASDADKARGVGTGRAGAARPHGRHRPRQRAGHGQRRRQRAFPFDAGPAAARPGPDRIDRGRRGPGRAASQSARRGDRRDPPPQWPRAPARSGAAGRDRHHL